MNFTTEQIDSLCSEYLNSIILQFGDFFANRNLKKDATLIVKKDEKGKILIGDLPTDDTFSNLIIDELFKKFNEMNFNMFDAKLIDNDDHEIIISYKKIQRQKKNKNRVEKIK